MSAPIGYLKALIYGVPFTFDGKKWTYPDDFPNCIEEYARPVYVTDSTTQEQADDILSRIRFLFEHMVRDLNSIHPWMRIGHHTHLRARAEIILKYAAGEEGRDWQIVECIPNKAWDNPLPYGAID